MSAEVHIDAISILFDVTSAGSFFYGIILKASVFMLFVLACGLQDPLRANDMMPQDQPVKRQQSNKILDSFRIPVEFNAFPGTQWAPRSIDPDAKNDKNFFTFKVKPFIPISLNDRWSLLSYTVFHFRSLPWADPVVSLSPAGVPMLEGWNPTTRTGLSSISPTVVLSPNTGPDLTLGIGPSLSAPVGTYPTGPEQWRVGPALFAAYKKGPWLVGARIHNMWSIAGNPDLDDTHMLIIRPRIQYAINKKWFLISSPLITNDWTHSTGKGWLLPIGGGIGRSFRMGSTRVNASLQAYFNAIRPETMQEKLLGEWNIRTEINFVIPK